MAYGIGLLLIRRTLIIGGCLFKAVGSVVLHVLFLVALKHQVRGVAKVPLHRTARVLKAYAPGRTAVVQPPKPKILPPKEEPKLAMKEPEPPPPSSSGDPSGEADVSVAMANFYPTPKPDLFGPPTWHTRRCRHRHCDQRRRQGLGHSRRSRPWPRSGRGSDGDSPDLDLYARDQGWQAGGERAATSIPFRARLIGFAARSLHW